MGPEGAEDVEAGKARDDGEMGAEESWALGRERAEEDSPAAVGAGGGGTDADASSFPLLRSVEVGVMAESSFHELNQPPGTCFPVDILVMGAGLCTP